MCPHCNQRLRDCPTCSHPVCACRGWTAGSTFRHWYNKAYIAYEHMGKPVWNTAELIGG